MVGSAPVEMDHADTAAFAHAIRSRPTLARRLPATGYRPLFGLLQWQMRLRDW
ncbi:hypothetical protein XHC_4080 [Xanthomonas hortorum pv. carotae str. M081]|nr:hypothetical protein XHC_4080 [Xanthomonas hortorum pv. carotae str. M081]